MAHEKSVRAFERPIAPAFCMALSVLAVSGCGAEAPSAAEETAGSARQPVELYKNGTYFDVSVVHSGAWGDAQRATGAVVTYGFDKNGVMVLSKAGKRVGAPCGATLVSPRHVITAAHCVGTDSAPTLDTPVTLQMPTHRAALEQNDPATGRPRWQRAAALSGPGPEYTHDPLTEADGWSVEEFSCKVLARCGRLFQPTPNCAGLDTPSEDIALLDCPTEPGNKYGWVNIADNDTPGVEVRLNWYHEIYDVSRANSGDQFDHYRQSPSDSADVTTWDSSYHYRPAFGTIDRAHFLLPLASKPWPDGTPRVKTTDLGGAVITDAMGCHGTSGTGFMQLRQNIPANCTSFPCVIGGEGTWELLGPTLTSRGNDIFGPLNLLCDIQDPFEGPGTDGTVYGALASTQAMKTLIPPCFGNHPLWTLCAQDVVRSVFHFELLTPVHPPDQPSPITRWIFHDEPIIRLTPGASFTIPEFASVTRAVYRTSFRFFPQAVGVAKFVLAAGSEVLQTFNFSVPEQLLGVTLPAFSTTFVAPNNETPVTISLDPSSIPLGINEIVLVRNDAPITFDTFDERAGAGAVPLSGGKLDSASFAGDSGGGFSAIVHGGERFVVTRASLPPAQTWDVRFDTPGSSSPMSCGLLLANGSETRTSCTAGASGVALSVAPDQTQPVLGFYIDNPAGAADVTIDDMSLQADAGCGNMLGLAASDWPVRGACPTGRGRSRLPGPQTSRLKWSVPVFGAVRSSPVIGPDGAVYFGTEGDKMYALRPDGSQKWPPVRMGEDVETAAALSSDGFLYVGVTDGKLYKLRTDTGGIVWKFATGAAITSSPVIGADGTIYFGSKDRFVYALRADGSLRFKFATTGAVESSPTLSPDGSLYVGSNDDFLYALRTKDGLSDAQRLIWKVDLRGDVSAMPTVGPAPSFDVFVGSRAGFMRRIRATDGAVLWQSRTVLGLPITSAAALGTDGTVYFGADDARVHAVSASGQELWTFSTGLIKAEPAIGADGIVYIGSDDGFFYALRPDPGLTSAQRLSWKRLLGGFVRSSPAIGSGGVLSVGSDIGQLFAFGP